MSPNGQGRDTWIHRRNDTMWKLLGVIFVPAIAWLLITVIGHSEEIAARGVEVKRSTTEQAQAEDERHEISKKVERLDERINNYQHSNDAAHARQDGKLDRILQQLSR